MTRVRCITEMGMGVDVHGKDATKAAKRAVSDAIRPLQLGFFRMLARPRTTCSSMSPSACRPRRGRHFGGRQRAALWNGDDHRGRGRAGNSSRAGGDSIIIANAAVIVSLDDGQVWLDIRREGSLAGHGRSLISQTLRAALTYRDVPGKPCAVARSPSRIVTCWSASGNFAWRRMW